MRVTTIMPRRVVGDSIGGAIGTKCDHADVVAAVMSAIFGQAAGHAGDRKKPASLSPSAAKRAG